MQASASSAKADPASSALAEPLITCTPMRKACSRWTRRTASMASSKPSAARAASPITRTSSAFRGAKKPGSSKASSTAGRRARVRASSGANAITLTSRSSSCGSASSSDCTCTPEARPEKKSTKRLKASSGAPEASAASSRRGARRVKSSRLRSLRVALMRPWCQARMVPETRAGSEKPMRRRVSNVSGSSSTPVNTRLPKREASASSSGNSSP